MRSAILAVLMTAGCAESRTVENEAAIACESAPVPSYGESCAFSAQLAALESAYADAPYGRALTDCEHACLADATIETAELDEYEALCPTDPLGGCYSEGVYEIRGDTWPNTGPDSQRLVIMHLMAHRLIECTTGDADPGHAHDAFGTRNLGGDLAMRAWQQDASAHDLTPIYPCD